MQTFHGSRVKMFLAVFRIEWTLAYTKCLPNRRKRETFSIKVQMYNGYHVCVERGVDNFEVLDVRTSADESSKK